MIIVTIMQLHEAAWAARNLFFFFFYFLDFLLVPWWGKKRWNDTRIQLTPLHSRLPVSRNARTCLQQSDNPAGAPLHSARQGLCVIMSSSLYKIQPITHHLPDGSNGQEVYWFKKIFWGFFLFLILSLFPLSAPCRLQNAPNRLEFFFFLPHLVPHRPPAVPLLGFFCPLRCSGHSFLTPGTAGLATLNCVQIPSCKIGRRSCSQSQ